MFAEEFLLNIAIGIGDVETVFLLLCAGVPICNCSIEDLTPLEVAHNTKGLPALFPALMRKVYADKLKDEISKIVSNDDTHQKLKNAMGIMVENILQNGHICNWKFDASDKKTQNIEAKKLLCVASSLGLSLTVKLLGLEDVDLHPLPGEENPVYNALCGHHIDTLYALFRDLKFAPYTTAKQENIPRKVKLDFWITENKIFKRKIYDDVNQLLLDVNEKEIESYLNKIEKLKLSNSDEKYFDIKFLYMLSRYGLVYLLHQLLQTDDINLNQVIQPFSGCTMLHISSHYGHLNFTEYLLHHEANPSIKTKGNFTAAHIAGISGQEETMHFLFAYMNYLALDVNESCILKTTAEVMFKQNSETYKSSNFHTMKSKDAIIVRNEVKIEDKAYQILKTKGKFLSIKCKDDLIKAVNKLQANHNSLNKKQADDVVSELKIVINELKGTPFEGNLKGHNQFYEGNELVSNNEVKFILELKNFSAMTKNSNITLLPVKKDSMIYSIEARNNKIFKDGNFINEYIDTFKNLLENYKPSSAKLCLEPPFLIPYKKGVILFWIWCSENTCRQVRSFIEPVIKADWPTKEYLKALPEDKRKICTSDNYIHLHPHDIKGHWTLHAYDFVREIFKTLTKDERTVWVTCKLMTLLIKKEWWTPNNNGRQAANRFGIWAIGVEALPERALRTLFLKELTVSPSSKWGKKYTHERVCSIFRQAVEKDEDGNLKVIKEFKPVTLPETPLHINYSCLLGIIKYLEELPTESGNY
ncbi:unnamed protein product [Meganyctiphanes norvegica]|uniref:Uncharacterized protein n=1 Tax=Meganyctiphanes norvegica TaxID=48144 RepID=A0AAV2SGG3_MEGNR